MVAIVGTNQENGGDGGGIQSMVSAGDDCRVLVRCFNGAPMVVSILTGKPNKNPRKSERSRKNPCRWIVETIAVAKQGVLNKRHRQ